MKEYPTIPIHFTHLLSLPKRTQQLSLQSIKRVVASGVFLNGSETNNLEKELSKIFAARYVSAVASGHDALFLSLMSLSLHSLDEIMFPVNVYPTAFPICLSHGKPIPVDVDENGQISLIDIKRKVTKRTKVIILVHLFGLVGDIDEILSFAKKRKIIVVEDCAQAFGTQYKGKIVGTFGDIACLSFYPTKNLFTFGDGGAVISKSKRVSTFITKARSYGEDVRYNSTFVSGHSRIPEIQASVIRLMLTHFSKESENRKEKMQAYLHRFKKASLPQIRMLRSYEMSDPVPHLMVIAAEKRDKLRTYLTLRGIPTCIHYPRPIHLVKAFSFLGKKQGAFPQAEKLATQIVSLPFHPSIQLKQIDYIVKSIADFYKR